MEGYIITSFIILAYLIYGIILIIRKPVKLDITKKIFLSLLLFCFYFYPLVETVTNSSPTNIYFLKFLPTYNYTPLMFVITIASLLTKGKISDFLKTFVILMMVPVLYGIGDQYYHYIITFKYFNEKYALYTIGQATIILYGVYLLRNKEVNLKLHYIVLSVLAVTVIYLFAFLHNNAYGTSFFGLTLNENAYIYDSIKLKDYDLSLIFNFVSLPVTMFLTGIVAILAERKTLH